MSTSSRVRSSAVVLIVALCLVGTVVSTVSAQGSTGGPAATPVTDRPDTAEVRAWLAFLERELIRLLHSDPTSDGSTPAGHGPTLAQLVGQKLMVRMSGHRPSRALLGRIRRGEIGGVVLLGADITTRAAVVELTSKLQNAASAGGQPTLLIALDQEGGSVKRVPWAPPTITVPAMGRLTPDVARRQGRRTGAALRALGINMDLAPVADVPRSTASFMYQQGRTFGFDAGRTAALADAFAAGLGDRGVIATMKHFPGIGLATRNTDRYVDTIGASADRLSVDLRPYRRAIAHDLPVIMLSNATYPAWDPDNAAGWSPAIAVSLLRDELGFRGVTITDSLDGTGHARGLPVKVLGLRAAIAGTDMILTTGSEKTTTRLFDDLLAHARGGSLPRSTLQASYDRILDLKLRVAPRVHRG